jgi:hypothetical protein
LARQQRAIFDFGGTGETDAIATMRETLKEFAVGVRGLIDAGCELLQLAALGAAQVFAALNFEVVSHGARSRPWPTHSCWPTVSTDRRRQSLARTRVRWHRRQAFEIP